MLSRMTPPRVIDGRALLERIPVFAGLNRRELDLLYGITSTRRLRTREVLFRKGDEGATLYGVMRGRLRVFSGIDAKEVIFKFLEPGEVFGEIALLDSQPRSATISAVEPVELLVLQRRDFLPFLEQHPKVAIQLATALAQRLRALSDSMEDAMLLSISGRLAKKLLALVQAHGKPVPGGTRIDLKLPQHELGELVGATRESVNKHMRAWTAAGVLRMERGIITVLDEEALEAAAGYALF
jgi:CRP/FNR family transcriptional regulator, cyclic AMP receptor protein